MASNTRGWRDDRPRGGRDDRRLAGRPARPGPCRGGRAHAVRRRAGERVRSRPRQPLSRRRDIRPDPAGDGGATRRRVDRRPHAVATGGLDARARSPGSAARRRWSALHRPVHPCRAVRRPRRWHRTDEPGARRRGRRRPDQRSTRAPRPLAHPQGPRQPDLVTRRAGADRADRGDAGRAPTPGGHVAGDHRRRLGRRPPQLPRERRRLGQAVRLHLHPQPQRPRPVLHVARPDRPVPQPRQAVPRREDRRPHQHDGPRRAADRPHRPAGAPRRRRDRGARSLAEADRLRAALRIGRLRPAAPRRDPAGEPVRRPQHAGPSGRTAGVARAR